MSEDLKPCPFCGGTASIERYGEARQSTIYQCDHCSCRLETGEEWGHGRDWNRRILTCQCTMIEQDETCPVGYPSLTCEYCDGKGHIAQDRLAQELNRMREALTNSVSLLDQYFSTFGEISGSNQADIEDYRAALNPVGAS